MDIYHAVLAAANQIERRPDLFDFMESSVPPDCGTPGCVLGWISHFIDARGRAPIDKTAEILGFKPDDIWIGSADRKFYAEMDSLAGVGYSDFPSHYLYKWNSWRFRPTECARLLRLFAKRFAPQIKVVQFVPPEEMREALAA